MKWGVSGKKFLPDKWCDGCLKHYADTELIRQFKPDKKEGTTKKKRPTRQ